MTNRELAGAYLDKAKTILGEIQSLFEKGEWNTVVRRSQEVVELSLKAVLRLVGVEIPPVHDVGLLLKRHQEKLPRELREGLSRFVSISRWRRPEREISFAVTRRWG